MTKSKSPAFQFYPKQWLGDDNVMLMDWDAKGMHLHFMCIAWQQESKCSLPDDDAILMRWVSVTNEEDWKKRLKPQIFRAWKLKNGNWEQDALRREFIKQKENSKKRKKAAKTRWEKEKKGDANA